MTIPGGAAAAVVLLWLRGREPVVDPDGSFTYRGQTVLLVGPAVLVEDADGHRSGEGYASALIADRAWRTRVLRGLST